MDVLGIISEVVSTVGITPPTSVYGNMAEDVQQMLGLFNQQGRNLAKRHQWQALIREASFTTVATEVQGSIATITGSSSVRRIVNDTLWNRSTMDKLEGSLSPQLWQASRAQITTGPYPNFRIRNGQLLLTPVPAAGQVVWFEYLTADWCSSSDGLTTRSAVGSDGDVVLLDEDLMRAGFEWRYLRKKGLSYSEEFTDYELLVKTRIGDDVPRMIISMDCYEHEKRPGIRVPDGNWDLS